VLRPLRKVKKMQLPPRHEDTRIDYVEGFAVHKALIFNELSLVQLSAPARTERVRSGGFVPLWQKKYNSEWTQIFRLKRGLIVLLIMGCICHSLSAQVSDSMKYTVLAPSEFLLKIQSTPNAVIIDVRAVKDYKKSRIKGAINIPYPVKDEYFISPSSISTDKSLFIYCYAGFSSKKSAIVFYNKGFRNNYSLEGGFAKWRHKKMEVERRKR
jgi:rhodanese-related sulfurtransferase